MFMPVVGAMELHGRDTTGLFPLPCGHTREKPRREVTREGVAVPCDFVPGVVCGFCLVDLGGGAVRVVVTSVNNSHA